MEKEATNLRTKCNQQQKEMGEMGRTIETMQDSFGHFESIMTQLSSAEKKNHQKEEREIALKAELKGLKHEMKLLESENEVFKKENMGFIKLETENLKEKTIAELMRFPDLSLGADIDLHGNFNQHRLAND
jgi:hypothetical protein